MKKYLIALAVLFSLVLSTSAHATSPPADISAGVEELKDLIVQNNQRISDWLDNAHEKEMLALGKAKLRIDFLLHPSKERMYNEEQLLLAWKKDVQEMLNRRNNRSREKWTAKEIEAYTNRAMIEAFQEIFFNDPSMTLEKKFEALKVLEKYCSVEDFDPELRRLDASMREFDSRSKFHWTLGSH